MAVGTSEQLDSGFYGVTPRQQQIAIRTIGMMTAIMRGDEGARINPSEAIPPAGQVPGVQDASPAIGSVVDLNV